jgi:hypothetical protein
MTDGMADIVIFGIMNTVLEPLSWGCMIAVFTHRFANTPYLKGIWALVSGLSFFIWDELWPKTIFHRTGLAFSAEDPQFSALAELGGKVVGQANYDSGTQASLSGNFQTGIGEVITDAGIPMAAFILALFLMGRFRKSTES